MMDYLVNHRNTFTVLDLKCALIAVSPVIEAFLEIRGLILLDIKGKKSIAASKGKYKHHH